MIYRKTRLCEILTKFEVLEKVGFAGAKSQATTERQDYCWETES